MARPEFDFGDKSLSGEERLGNLFALDRGLVLGMVDVLRRVGAYNDLLEEELENRPAAIEYLDRSQGVVARAGAWLQSWCDQVSLPVGVEPFGVCLMLDGIAKRCRAVLAEERRLQLELPGEEVIVAGSLLQLQDLFMKVILDSCGRYGGDVTVRVEVRSLDDAFFTLMRSKCGPGRYVIVRVADNQTPFAPDRQACFWDVLLAGDGDGAGDALELLQVYGTMLGHAGDVFFQQRGAGVPTLNLVLPVQEKRKDMQAPHNLDDQSLCGDETILLVDDEDMIWDVIIDMLQELGYTVILAGNGREAVEIYRANPGQVDLVILDMVMPELDGHEAFFALKQIDPDIKVLLSSGYVSEDEARDVLDAGAIGFLQKPYRMVDLARRVRAIFDKP